MQKKFLLLLWFLKICHKELHTIVCLQLLTFGSHSLKYFLINKAVHYITSNCCVSAMVSSMLIIEARDTFFSENSPNHQTVKEHIWSVMSHYMLVVQYSIAKHPQLHARVICFYLDRPVWGLISLCIMEENINVDFTMLIY